MTDDRRPDLFPPKTTFVGDYRIEDVLDEGGMGVVYRATEIYIDDPVAIKCLLPRHANREDFLQRFQQECRFYPQLKHANIVKVRRAGVSPPPERIPFLVMDLLEGKTLRKILNSYHRLDYLNTLYIMVQVADPMHFAHTKGIWHRDLKPENIMVGTRGDQKGYVWVLDFGIAKAANGSMNTDDLPDVGTARYMSPEQAENILSAAKKKGRLVQPDGRVDIYAFGVIFYEVLTGQHIFIDEKNPPTFEQTLAGHVLAQPRPVVELVPDCPEAVWPVIARCLAKDREARYQTFDEIARDIRALIQRELSRKAVPENHPLAKRMVEEEAQSARKEAFSHVELEGPADEADGEHRSAIPPEAPHVEEMHEEAAAEVTRRSAIQLATTEPVNAPAEQHEAAHRVTVELPNFVPSGNALPFDPAASVATPAAAVERPTEPAQRVTTELSGFVPSANALPFVVASAVAARALDVTGPLPTTATPVAPALPTKGRGRGATIRMPPPAPRPQFPSGGFSPEQEAWSAPTQQASAPTSSSPTQQTSAPTSSAPTQQASAPSSSSPPRQPSPRTPTAMSATLRPSRHLYLMGPLIGLAITIAGTVGVLFGRAYFAKPAPALVAPVVVSAPAAPSVSAPAAPPALALVASSAPAPSVSASAAGAQPAISAKPPRASASSSPPRPASTKTRTPRVIN